MAALCNLGHHGEEIEKNGGAKVMEQNLRHVGRGSPGWKRREGDSDLVGSESAVRA